MENICIMADIPIRQIYYIRGTVGIFIVAVIPIVPIFFTHGMASMYIVADTPIHLTSCILGTESISTKDDTQTLLISFIPLMGSHLYKGRYTNSSDILMTFDAPVPVIIMLLNTI